VLHKEGELQNYGERIIENEGKEMVDKALLAFNQT